MARLRIVGSLLAVMKITGMSEAVGWSWTCSAALRPPPAGMQTSIGIRSGASRTAACRAITASSARLVW